MMKVGVQLDDGDFAQVLVKGLAAEGRNLCFGMVDDGVKVETFDLILTDRELEDRRFIQLVRTVDAEQIYEGPPYRIFRYTRAREFVNSLLYIFHHETGRNLEYPGDTRCKTLVFTSISGGLDATALALLMGEILYQHFGCSCLYLNLCPIDGSKCFLPGGNGKGLLTLLYHLSQEKDFPLSSFIRQHSYVDYIDTSIFNPYFDELDASRLHRFLTKIDDLGKYTYLILDIGNHLSRCNKSLLTHAEEIILVTGDRGQVPALFLSEVMHLLEQAGGETKIRQVFLEERKLETVESEGALQENGLLDLASMKYIQWEVGRLVKNMMERNDD